MSNTCVVQTTPVWFQAPSTMGGSLQIPTFTLSGHLFNYGFGSRGLCWNAPPLEQIPKQSIPCPYLNISRCPICNEWLRPSSNPEQYCEPCRSNGLHQWNMHIWKGAYTAIFKYGDHNSVERCSVWLCYDTGRMELSHHFKDGKDWNGQYRPFWSTHAYIGAFDFNPQDYHQTIRQIEALQLKQVKCGICDHSLRYYDGPHTSSAITAPKTITTRPTITAVAFAANTIVMTRSMASSPIQV
jgi:hypothetical protein